MDRLILHCDLNNFYASVECLLNPEIRDKPVAVTGDPEKRHGVILAKNEIAKKAGIKTGDVIWQAKQKQPDLICVKPHFSLYSEYSKRVFDIYTEFTDQVEPFGPDECWLDCTGSQKLFGSGKIMADTIRNVVFERTGLTISVGVSFNKTFAKMASDLKKPDATTVIDRSNYKKRLWTLPVGDMLMVGRKTEAQLKLFGIHTVGDLANADPALLKAKFGVNGEKLRQNALGEDDSTVRQYIKSREVESVGHGMTSIRDLWTYKDVETLITYLADKVATRLRKNDFRGYGIHLDVRRSDLTHKSRQKTLNSPICTAKDIVSECKALLREIWKEDCALRTIAVSVFSLVPISNCGQISFFGDEERNKNERLENAIDGIRKKYGHDKIVLAGVIGTDFIYDKNDDEDFLPFKR